MAINSLQSRDDFIQYILRRLGEPVIAVNVSIEQISDRVDDALKLFYESHMEATEQVFIVYNFTDTDLDLGYVQLQPDIFEVSDVMIPNPSAGIFSVEYQLQLENLFSTSLITNFGDMTYYTMTQMNINLINRIFVPLRQFSYNNATNKLIITGGLKATNNLAGGIVIKAKKIIYGEASEVPASQTDSNGNDSNLIDSNDSNDTNNEPDPNPQDVLIAPQIYNNKWLQAYATALVQIQWGSNLSKFANVPLLGGVMLDGKSILEEGNRHKEELESELYSKYQLPVDFSIG